MRWTRNDTEAYKTVSDAGEKIRGMYDKYRAGQAYNQGAQVDQARNTAGDYAPASLEGPKYRLGGENGTSYTQAPTALQKHQAGLQAQMEHYAAIGDTETAGKLMERMQALESHGLQMESARQNIEKGGYEVKKLKSYDAARQKLDAVVNDPAAYFAERYNANQGQWGQGNHANTEVKHLIDPKTGDGVFWTVDRETGERIEGSTKNFSAQEARDLAMKEFVASTDPSTLMTLAQKDKQHGETLRNHLEGIEKQTASHEKTNKYTADQHLAGQKIAANARSMYVPKYGVPSATLTDGTPVQFATDGSGAVNALTGKPLSAEQVKLLPKLTGEKAAKAFPDSTITAFNNKYMDADPASRRALLLDMPELAAAAGHTRGGGGLAAVKPKEAEKRPEVAQPAGAAPVPFASQAFGPGGGMRPVPVPAGVDNSDAWGALLRGGIYGRGGLSGN